MSDLAPKATNNLALASAMARIIGRAGKLGLSRDTIDAVKKSLESALAGADAPPRPSATELQESPAPSVQTGEASFREAQRELASLVQKEAPWSAMAATVAAMFDARPDAKMAARATELALVHGSLQEAQRLVEQFSGMGTDYFFEIHPAVRDRLSVAMWLVKRWEPLRSFLLRDLNRREETDLERLLTWLCLKGAADAEVPLRHYSYFQSAIHEAVGHHGAVLGMDEGSVYLNLSHLLIDAGRPEQAAPYLRRISKGSVAYSEASAILLKYFPQAPKRRFDVEAKLAVGTWQERIGFLRLCMDSLRRGQGEHGLAEDLSRVFQDPCAYVNAEPQAIAELVSLILEFSELDSVVTSMLRIFQLNALKFQKREVEEALWQNLAEESREAEPNLQLWWAVALIHRYVGRGPDAEEDLWMARRALAGPREFAIATGVPGWADLHRSATHAVSRASYIDEESRVRMLSQLRVAGDPRHVVEREIAEYVRDAVSPPIVVLHELGRMAAARASKELQWRIWRAKAERFAITNDDLNAMWRSANARMDHDLAWRVATIAAARDVISSDVRHAWEICGEKRGDYPLQRIMKNRLDACFSGFSPSDLRTLHCLVAISPVLGELLAILEPDQHRVVDIAHHPASVEGKVARFLASLDWLPSNTKIVRLNGGEATAWPPFVKILPSNTWTAVVQGVSDFLGFNAWGWSVASLRRSLEGISSRSEQGWLTRRPDRVGKWLRSLSAEQRMGWNDLAQLGRDDDGERLVDLMSSFVVRLSTAIYPNHLVALKSLQTMQAPLGVIRAVEAWVVSEGCTALRTEAGLGSRVPIPNLIKDRDVVWNTLETSD